MNTGLRRAGIVGLSTVVAASMMTFSAATAQADWAAAGGDIGLVDTNTTTAGTQGAKLVYPGVAGQALGDIRIAIPNSFVNGDTIDLAIFDRTATNTSNGQINADTAHKLGFSGAPTVTVNPTPYVAGTTVGPTSGTAGNTEATPAADVAADKGVQPPVFTTSLVASSRAGGLATDIIRLRVNAVQATVGTNPLDKWIITVSGIKADLGTAVSPGELRVVPFAYNGTSAQTFTSASPVFESNLADSDGLPDYDPVINLYTVPAYVAPATFTVGAPSNIVGDGTTQSVGDIIIAETNEYSLQNGSYTVTVAGANIMNTTPPTVTVTGAAAGPPAETVTATTAGNVLTFVVANASNTGKLSIKISGLLLSAATEGAITYTLAGGSIDGNAVHSFLVEAGDSLEIPLAFAGVSGVGGVLADSAFGMGVAVNQTDIVAPGFVVNSAATPLASRLGGNDRYETAAKIAANNGPAYNVILASGMDFPDALSSGYLSQQLGGASILLTKQGSIPAATLNAMRTLGTHVVYVIGGTGAISAGVEAQLRATPQWYTGGEVTDGQGKLQVIRLGGVDRFATNEIVNQRAAALVDGATAVGRTSITFGQSSKLTALVATGEDFADALAAGPSADGAEDTLVDMGNLPLILTKSASLSPAASRQMNNLGIQQAVILGGTGAVSATVATSIEALGAAVHRIGGANRFETAAMIADFETAAVAPTVTVKGGLGFDSIGGNFQRAYLATGSDFADALAGGPRAGGQRSPMMLTAPTALSPATSTWLTAHAANYSQVVGLGLGGALSNSTLAAANAAVAGG